MGNLGSSLFETPERNSSSLFGTNERNSSRTSSKRSSSPVWTKHGEVLNVLCDNHQIEGSLKLTGGLNLIHEGVLNIKGNGNTIKRLTFYLRQDAYGKTVTLHNDVLMVTGKGYRITGTYNIDMHLEKSYIKHKGSLSIQGNGNVIQDIRIYGKCEQDLTHNMHSDIIEIIGNDNIVRNVKLYLNQVMGPVNVKMNEILRIRGNGNRTNNLETWTEYKEFFMYDHGCYNSNGDSDSRYIDENLFDENITQAIENYRKKNSGGFNMSGSCLIEKFEDNDPLFHTATLTNSTSSGQSQGDPGNTAACPQQCENPTSSSVTEDLNALCQQLAQELNALKVQRLCIVCKGKDSCMTFIPCGHFVSCEDCCKVDRCPVCQSPVDNTVKTFFP